MKTRQKHTDIREQYIETIPFWGVESQGAKLYIYDDTYSIFLDKPTTIDVETDENDNFVGIAVTQDGNNIYYFTDLKYIKTWLEYSSIIGHNVKGDIKWLKQWGVGIKPEKLHYDTILASYVHNTTKKSHGLKDLAKEYLDMEWPSYKDLVGTGKKKRTLDQQDTELVANYCGMDCLATYRLYKYFEKTLTDKEKKYLHEIELPTSRVLMEMELKGIKLDIEHLEKLDLQFANRCLELEDKIKDAWFVKCGQDNKEDKPLNVNSNKQIAELLTSYGVELPKTNKGNDRVDKNTLKQFDHLSVVQDLLEYSKINKLRSTYTKGLLKQRKNGIIHCNFNQISKETGIGTGRLSSSGPNLQNIPARTEEGMQIRQGFVARKGHVLADFDFSQIEPRLVAHITKDKTFLDAYNNDRDIYQELVEGTGRSRDDGKTFMLALLYGAQAKKLASVFKCDENESQKIIESIMSKLPAVQSWIESTKFMARKNQYVETLYGRRIPVPGINNDNKWERLHWERVAVNSVIQGSAAEIMKKSLIRLYEEGYSPILTVHDSFMLELKDNKHFYPNLEKISSILENIVKLDVPLKVSVGVGTNWKQCKDNEIK